MAGYWVWGKENPLLVLASGYDPQFATLNELPRTVCGEVAACAQAGKDATVILLWSGTREPRRGYIQQVAVSPE